MNKQLSIFFIVFIFLAFLISCKDNHPRIIEDDLPPIPDIEVPEEMVNRIPLSRYFEGEGINTELIYNEIDITGEAEYSLKNHDNQDDGYVYLCLFGERKYEGSIWDDYYCLLKIAKSGITKERSLLLDKIRLTPAQLIVFVDSFAGECSQLWNYSLETGALTTLMDDQTLLFSTQGKDNLFLRISDLEEYVTYSEQSHFRDYYLFNLMMKAFKNS